MNRQHSGTYALQVKLNYNVTEATKNICSVKNEGAIDHNTVTRWFKKKLRQSQTGLKS